MNIFQKIIFKQRYEALCLGSPASSQSVKDLRKEIYRNANPSGFRTPSNKDGWRAHGGWTGSERGNKRRENNKRIWGAEKHRIADIAAAKAKLLERLNQ